MTPKRGVIVQDTAGTVPAGAWADIREAGATHALLFLPWTWLEPQPGAPDWAYAAGKIEPALAAGLTVIVRVCWPVPPWLTGWASVNGDGQTTADPRLFLPLGRCPSLWSDAPWERIYRLQTGLWERWPELEFSPPGQGGGEWTHPTSHGKPDHRAFLQRGLWCFCPSALADWERCRKAGLVTGDLPPRGFPEAYLRRGFTHWYAGGLRRRLSEAAARTPGTPWLALIPKPGNFPENVCAGQPLLDWHVAKVDCHVMIHCLFGPGNTTDSRDYAFNAMRLWRGKIAAGVEGWAGMEDNSQALDRTAVTHLLVSGADLPEHRDALALWSRYWRR